MYALVSDEDYDELSKYNWQCNYGKWGTRAYARVKGKYLAMHRFIMKAKIGQYVDHKNHNTMDNQRQNLRFCTTQQNAMNRLRAVTNKSGYKGVSFVKNYDKCWLAQIKINGKVKNLGRFFDKVEAAKCYDLAAKENYGEFALTNFV